MRTEYLCISVLREASGPRLKLASCKSALTTPTPRWFTLLTVLRRWSRCWSYSLLLVVYSTRRFVLCLTLCILFLCFSVILALQFPRLENRELILVLFVRLFDLCLFGFVGYLFLLVSGKGWGCDCGTPWTFLLSLLLLLFFFFFLLWQGFAFLFSTGSTLKDSSRKTCLHNFDPLKPHFYIVKVGFTGVYIIFLISAQKHRAEAVLTSIHNLCFEQKYENIRVFFIFWKFLLFDG